MSLHLVASIANRCPIAATPYFLLGQDARGAWVIREQGGRGAALFRTRRAAIEFARNASPSGNFTIEHRPDGLELVERRRFSRAA